MKKMKEEKGKSRGEVQRETALSRADAIMKITEQHPDAAIIYCNGFTAREAQSRADRIGSFYNTGYMGGSLAIGWGLAQSNPDIEVVVVDGDQNALMSCMEGNLSSQYPDNLHWYILDNGIGASVGVSRSVPLPRRFYDMAKVIRTLPDEPGAFNLPRVKAQGRYFEEPSAKEMSDRIGPLPTHALRFKAWIQQQTERNRYNFVAASIDREVARHTI